MNRLILPERFRRLAPGTPEPESIEKSLGLTEEDAQAFIASNPAIQRDLKKARKAYARLQATIRYEAARLASSK